MSRKKKIILIIFFGAILIGASFFVYRRVQRNSDPDADLSLEEAARMGEVTTHKLLVQIENPRGRAEDLAGRYERGDIVLIFPADHDFSPAEKEGFLILRMDLTPKQAEIMVRAKEEEKSFLEKMQAEPVPAKQLKRRKFTVDLAKIGIATEDERGREIEDRIFMWDIVREK